MRGERSEVPTPHSIPDVGLSRADDPRRRTHLSADPAHELNNDRPEPLAILYFSQRPIPRKRRRQFCHKAGVQYLEDEAPTVDDGSLQFCTALYVPWGLATDLKAITSIT